MNVARAADEATTCPMGGPTPGYRVVRLDLPEGSDFLVIQPDGARTARPLSDSNNWHLTKGIYIVNAATLEIEAYRIESIGTAPRALVVGIDGTDVLRQGTVGPDGPFYHTASRPRASLPPGSYYAIGFGSDGGSTLPNDWWAGAVRVEGKHSCAPIGSAQVFDIDQTEFTGGTHVYAQGVGMADGIAHTYEPPAGTDLVVGLLDAGVQGPGEAELSFTAPSGTFGVEDEIAPFISGTGAHDFTASYQGAFPLILAAGVSINLP